MKILFLLSAAMMFTTVNLSAQMDDPIQKRKVQVTFGYPIGSNGGNSMEYINNFSFNILHGLNGGVNGAEIGMILNYNKGFVKGFQLSGISNVNYGYSKGCLLSSVSNICMDSTAGLFISGIVNYSRLKSSGFFLSGVTNIGIESQGTFISGVVNSIKSKSKGFFLSGVANVLNDSTEGVFISGVVNYAGHYAKGFQFGTVNHAEKMKGVQLGVVNILKEKEGGIPIGIFNIVKDGLRELELTGGDVIYSNLNYKMGIDKLYSIFKIGYSNFNGNPVLSSGFGFGRNIVLAGKGYFSVDVTANSIVYDFKWNKDLNLLNKIDFNYKSKINDKLTLLIGPSLNVYLTGLMVGEEYGSLNVPYTLYSKRWSDREISTWVGGNVGLSLKL